MKQKFRKFTGYILAIIAIIAFILAILLLLYQIGLIGPQKQTEKEIIETEDTYEYIEDDMTLLKQYQDYNSDVVGILRIPDTVLNHPVVQTVDDEDYYLYRDLDGDYNSHGVPFLSADSSLDDLGGNIVIYGHNIRINTRDVFADLAYYENLYYYQEHPIIETVSALGTRKWLIFAYYIVDNSDENPFRYSDTTSFLSEAALNEYLSEIEKRNWLSVPVDITYGDTLITLSSCSNELSGSGTNRMVVVGVLLQDGEEYEDIVENTVMADNPLLPEKLQ